MRLGLVCQGYTMNAYPIPPGHKAGRSGCSLVFLYWMAPAIVPSSYLGLGAASGAQDECSDSGRESKCCRKF